MNRWLRNVPRPELIAVVTSVVVSVALLVIKFVAYYLTGSAAVFSDALESVVNVIASMFAAYSLFLAHQPADEQHPYGHGKVEFMSAGFEGGMILLAAFLIIVRAIQAFVQGPHVTSLDAGLVLMAVAAVVNGVVGMRLVAAGKRRGLGDADSRWPAFAQRCGDERRCRGRAGRGTADGLAIFRPDRGRDGGDLHRHDGAATAERSGRRADGQAGRRR